MAYRIGVTTGNWNTASTWNDVVNTPTIHASTNITISTSGVFSVPFTAPNTTNAGTGVMVPISAKSTDGTLTLTLQEDAGGGSWSDVATSSAYTVTSLPTAFTWIYFPFTVPFTFTATTANKYRIKAIRTGSGGTLSFRADSGGSNFCYLATYNSTTVPIAGDRVYMGGNGTSQITITVDGTTGTFGAGEAATASNGTITTDMKIDNSILKWDTAASASLNCRGQIIVGSNGELQIGTVATPYPSGRTATLTFEYQGGDTNGNFGILQNQFTTTPAKVIVQGTPYPSTSLWKTKYVSGTGTAASPLVTSTAVDWTVGDEIAITATSANAQTEYKFIKTKNSATSYVLADTAGGAESALTHTHSTEAHIINLSRNVIITSTDAAKGWYYRNINQTISAADWDWARLHRTGGTASGKIGFQLTDSSDDAGTCDYCIFYEQVDSGIRFDTSKVQIDMTGLVFCRQRAAATGVMTTFTASSNNKSLTDCFYFDNQRGGVLATSSFNIEMTRCYFIDLNRDNVTTLGAVYTSTAAQLTLTDCDFACNLQQDLYLNPAVDSTFTNCRFSPYGTAPAQSIHTLSDVYITALFINCTSGSATLLDNYLTLIPGSLLRFHKHAQTENNHFWYTVNGTARSTGAGLADTTVKTAGSLGVRIAAETSDGLRHRYKVLAKADSAVSASGFLRMNSAFAGAANTALRIDLYLPGSSSPDATTTMTKVADTWDSYGLTANYTGDVSAYATVEVVATNPDAVSAAYVYHDDIFNGTNSITAIDVWDEGQPSPIMFEQLGDAAAVWAVLTSSLTTAGTTGKQQKDMLTTGKFLGLK